METNIKHYDTEYYTNLVSVRNVVYEEINRALEVVKEFIINKNLILTGGMAIDFALKLKGESIYTDNQIPDYDFYSTNHSADAYELGSILCKAGYSNISVINAIHITTMKVRIDFEVVADISYCPLSVFKQVPTLMYDKMRIVHPHWQMSDQHSSLALPFENPGKEVIFHRWKKDMMRYDKLYKHYPVVPVLETQDFTHKVKKYVTEATTRVSQESCGGSVGYQRSVDRENMAKHLEIPMQTVKVPMEKLRGSCICGWAAIDYKIDEDNIILSIPTDESITVASYDYKQFIKNHKIEVIEYRSEYFGKLPRRAICATDIEDIKGQNKKMEIYDIFGILVSAKKISEKYDLWVCNLQWVMLYLLIRIFSSKDPKIIFTSEEQYVRCRYLVIAGDYPSVEVYGKYNFTHKDLNSTKIQKERIYSIKSKQLQPLNMYPTPPECTNNGKFDPETSEYFMNDARKMESLIDWTLDPYPEYNIRSLR
jgi:hypothetical protein